MSSKVNWQQISSGVGEWHCIQSDVCVTLSALTNFHNENLLFIWCVWCSIYGAFVTGDNEGYVTAWDATSKRRLFQVFFTKFAWIFLILLSKWMNFALIAWHSWFNCWSVLRSYYFLLAYVTSTYFQLPRYPNSVASLSYNHRGQLLAVASSYTYQEANEMLVNFVLWFTFSVSFITVSVLYFSCVIPFVREEPPLVFIHEVDNDIMRSVSVGSSSRR